MMAKIKKLLTLFAPVLGIAFVYTLFFFYAPDAFHSVYNTKTILTQSVIFGIGALGMTAVIISGGIDLSVGSFIALGTVVIGLILRDYGGETMSWWLPYAAALAAVVVCAIGGFINGSIITGFGIVPFIVTLGMMQIARGVAKGAAEQTTILAPESGLNTLMIVEPNVGAWYSLAPGVWVALFLMTAMFVLLKFTVFGRYVFAIGSNEAAARLSGIRVGLVRIWVYTLCGALTGVASVFQFGNLTLGGPTAAVGMELDIIAAVVIGGGSLSGGEGGVVGSLAGALIMAILRNGCNMVGIPNYVQNIVIGSIIILAVGLDGLKHRKQSATAK